MQTVYFRTFDGSTSEGTINVREFTKAEITKRTTVRAVAYFLLALIFLPIPPIHLIVVPFGLIMCVRSLFATRNITSIIESGSGHCPACAKEVSIFKRPNQLPFRDVCEHCHRQIMIDAAIDRR